MKFFKRTCLSFLLLTTALAGNAQNFRLNGTSFGIADGSQLFLQIFNTEQKPERMDSAIVKNGQFSFAGSLKENHYVAVLRTADSKDQAMIWLEPKALSVTVKKGDFDNLAIKGSVASQEFQQFSSIMNRIRAQQDSLQKIDTKQDSVMEKEKWDQYEKIQLAETEAGKNFVRSHPNSVVSAFILNIFSTNWGRQNTEELYQRFSAAVKQSKPGQQIRQFIGLSKAIKVGDKYVDFELSNVNDKKIKLSSIKGKYILLDFWGSWCGPCRHENVNLLKAYRLFKDKGFNILGVAAETDKKEWLQAIKADGLLWENVTDVSHGKNNAAIMIYDIFSFPTNFLIDEQGTIIAKNLRGSELIQKLEELLR